MNSTAKKRVSARTIIILAIFAVLFVAMLVGGYFLLHSKQNELKNAVRVTVNDDRTFTIYAPTETLTIRYRDIKEIIYVKNMTAATLVYGEDTQLIASGVYTIDTSAQFKMFAYKKVPGTIYVAYGNEYVIFNLHETDLTMKLYEQLKGTVFVNATSYVVPRTESEGIAK